MDRLYAGAGKISGGKSKERVEYSRISSENVDPETGQPLFHPRTGRAPANLPRDGNINESLYKQSIKRKENAEKLKCMKEEQINQMVNSSYTNNNSDKIVQLRKKKAF